jgi:hypothetical protein
MSQKSDFVVEYPGRAELIQTSYRDNLASYFMVTHNYFPRSEMWIWTLTSMELYLHSPACLHGIVVKQMENFTFIFLQ